MKKKYKIIIGSIFAILIVVRIAAPPIILKKLNVYLADFSPEYYGHIEDFDLSLWRGAYHFDKLRIALKTSREKPFLNAETIDVSVAWRELFRGRILTDVVADNIKFIYSTHDFEVAKKVPVAKSAGEAKDVGHTLFPVTVERIDLRNSTFEDADVPGFSADSPFRITGIDGRISHLMSNREQASPFSLRGALMSNTVVKIVGSIDQTAQPVAWVTAAEFRELNLPEANSVLQKVVPLTFRNGHLDVYAEAKSEGGKITGYVKPFLKNATVMGDDKDFHSFKHFGVELTVATLNLFFRRAKDHVVATKFLFSYEKNEFSWNANETLSELFKNGYRQELAPGIENLLTLKKRN